MSMRGRSHWAMKRCQLILLTDRPEGHWHQRFAFAVTRNDA